MPLATTRADKQQLQKRALGKVAHSVRAAEFADREAYLQQLVAADRTTQRLGDDTRAQYELLLQRQETNYERQLQTAHTKLQEVLSSSISLVEHEKLLIAEGERNRRERDGLLLEHACEMKQLDAKWQQQWEMRARELEARFEDEKQRLRGQIPPLELARNDAYRLLKEQEIGRDDTSWIAYEGAAHMRKPRRRARRSASRSRVAARANTATPSNTRAAHAQVGHREVGARDEARNDHALPPQSSSEVAAAQGGAADARRAAQVRREDAADANAGAAARRRALAIALFPLEEQVFRSQMMGQDGFPRENG
ncbi:hypothetical protein FI667_g2049, partial [Globisporangium splendens]